MSYDLPSSSVFFSKSYGRPKGSVSQKLTCRSCGSQTVAGAERQQRCAACHTVSERLSPQLSARPSQPLVAAVSSRGYCSYQPLSMPRQLVSPIKGAFKPVGSGPFEAGPLGKELVVSA